jgi:hypothetical protein
VVASSEIRPQLTTIDDHGETPSDAALGNLMIVAC